jgi:hypothetical protein
MSEKGKGKRRQTKDRVLQARIPEELDEELRDRAEQLGLSVSTVVRNVLFNTFNLVEGVVSDSADIARAITGQKVPPSSLSPPVPAIPEAAVPRPDSAILGWQEAVLNKNGVCEKCNAILPLGERAAIGVPAQPRPVLMCLDCLAALSAAGSSPDADTEQQQVEDSPPPGKSRRRKKPTG